MKNLAEIVTEGNSKGEWCLWDYKDNDVREILIWKGNGHDQSDVTNLDGNGKELMNVTFEEVMAYCKKYKDAEVDKWHLDFYDADWNKIKDIF